MYRTSGEGLATHRRYDTNRPPRMLDAVQMFAGIQEQHNGGNGMSKPSDKLARRVDQLTAVSYDTIHTLTIIVIDGVLFLRVGDGKLERLGERLTRKVKI